MPSLDDLKSQLCAALDANPPIKMCFVRVLMERTLMPDWLNNRLIQILLRDVKDKIDIINGFVRTITNHDDQLLGELFQDKSGANDGFDAELGDILAEMNALRHVIGDGHSAIRKIPRAKNRTPDYSSTLDGVRYLFEVKNLRQPESVIDYLFIKLYSEKIQFPEVYEGQLLFEHSLKLDDLSPSTPNDRAQIDKLIFQIRSRMESGWHDFIYEWVRDGRNDGVRISIVCKRIDRGKFWFLAMPMSSAIQLDSQDRRDSLLTPLLRKTQDVVQTALKQLDSNGAPDADRAFILINWQKPPAFIFDHDGYLESAYRKNVQTMNSEIQITHPTISIRLLNWWDD
jgi:hypothetical protein